MNTEIAARLIHEGKAEIKYGFFIDHRTGFKTQVCDSDRADINMRNDIATIREINDLKRRANANKAALESITNKVNQMTNG